MCEKITVLRQNLSDRMPQVDVEDSLSREEAEELGFIELMTDRTAD